MEGTLMLKDNNNMFEDCRVFSREEIKSMNGQLWELGIHLPGFHIEAGSVCDEIAYVGTNKGDYNAVSPRELEAVKEVMKEFQKKVPFTKLVVHCREVEF
jgi:hypothetical protein